MARSRSLICVLENCVNKKKCTHSNGRHQYNMIVCCERRGKWEMYWYLLNLDTRRLPKVVVSHKTFACRWRKCKRQRFIRSAIVLMKKKNWIVCIRWFLWFLLLAHVLWLQNTKPSTFWYFWMALGCSSFVVDRRLFGSFASSAKPTQTIALHRVCFLHLHISI